MKKIVFSIVAVSLTLVVFAAVARAQTISRSGSDYNGLSNPGPCVVEPKDNGALRINCKHSPLAARVRFRFLRDVGATFDPADVSVDYDVHGGGAACKKSEIRWMVPEPRTVRFLVPAGCYVYLNSVDWAQPVH